MLRRVLLSGVVAALVFAALPVAPAAAVEPSGELIGTSVAGNIDGASGDEVFTVHAVEADPGSIDYTVEVGDSHVQDAEVDLPQRAADGL